MVTRNSVRLNSIDKAVKSSFQHLQAPCASNNLKPISYLIGSQKLLEHIARKENLLQCLQIGSTDDLDMALTTLRTLLRDCKTSNDCRLTVDKFAFALGAMDATTHQCALINQMHG